MTTLWRSRSRGELQSDVALLAVGVHSGVRSPTGGWLTNCGYAVHVQSPVLSRAEAVARLFAYEDEIRALGVSRLA